jgi:ABC-2 type transport system ATP-binding protein
VEEFVEGRRTWDRRRVASQESVVVAGSLDDGDWARARDLNVHLEPLSLQQVMVHAAGRTSETTKEKTNA